RACAREDEAGDAMVARGLEQRQRAHDVVAVVFAGIGDRLAHIGERREMHDGGWSITVDHLVEPRPVENVAALQGAPPDGPLVAVDKVVVGDRQIAGRGQRLAGVRADVAGAAGDEHGPTLGWHQRAPWKTYSSFAILVPA